jgi:hypothetical protein
MPSLFETIKNDYPTNREGLMRILENANNLKQLNNYEDFANIIAKYEESETHGDEFVTMTVYMSSTWAITQEFLNNINDADLKSYTRGRSGNWSDDSTDSTITFRDLMNILQARFPLSDEHSSSTISAI